NLMDQTSMRMKSLGYKGDFFSDENKILWLMVTMPSELSPFASSTRYDKAEDLKFSSFKAMLLTEEARLSQSECELDPSLGTAMLTRKPLDKTSMSKVKCYSCQELGHFARNCPKRKNNKKVVNGKTETSMIASLLANTSQSVISSSWIIDSGASNHMCN